MKAFAGETCTFAEVDEHFCRKFKDFLLAQKRLSNNTASAYFDKFKYVIREAYKQKMLKENPAENLKSMIGLTDWQTGEVKSVTIRLFNEWLDRRGGIGAFDVSEGCRKIIAVIDKRAHSDFHDLDDELKPKSQNRIGYKRRSDDGGTEFIFTSPQFADLCKGYTQKRILSELENLGFLITYSEARSKQLMVALPDFKNRQRCYVLMLDSGS